MLTCQFCNITAPKNSDEWQLDKHEKGFWCETCDGYTYFISTKGQHRFKLILEDSSAAKISCPYPPLKLSKRLSPYRYPGGKSKVIDYLYSHLQDSKTKILVSPFTGGGSFELAMLEAGVVDSLHLNDLDTGIFSFWWTVKHCPEALIDRLNEKLPTHIDYFIAQDLINNDYKGANMIEAAWASLLVNRLAYSGIVKANPLGGRHGQQESLLSRWNPNETIKRIERIYHLSDRIEISQENAVTLIEEAYWAEGNTLFIDPPYVKKGKDLYHCYYTERDHLELASLLDSLHHGMPGADILVTYDYSRWLSQLYRYPNIEKIGRLYSA